MTTYQGTVLSSPIPPYQNLAPEPQFYLPSQFNISAITLGVTTTVTTSVNHNYVIGQLIRLIIPSYFGCYQLNQSLGNVISIPNANQIVVSINSSRNVDPYIASSVTYPQVAQIVAVGDYNNGVVNSQGRINNGTFIPGSFIDISPL
jgi:hypothetical protein